MNSQGCFPDYWLHRGDFPRDWRLPNVVELTSLLDLQYWGPAISNDDGISGPCGSASGDCSFTGLIPNFIFLFWTSTPAYGQFSPPMMWLVNIGDGGITPENLVGLPYAFYVWPVRGGR